jgi:translation initiation factor 5B
MKSKKDKKQKAKAIELNDAEDQNIATSKAPVELTAEEVIEEEWGPVKEKKKKDKKGKASPDASDEDDEREGLHPLPFFPLLSVDALADDPVPSESQATLERGNKNPNEIDESGVKVLSKKEKEKLKKEREKVFRCFITMLCINLFKPIG